MVEKKSLKKTVSSFSFNLNNPTLFYDNLDYLEKGEVFWHTPLILYDLGCKTILEICHFHVIWWNILKTETAIFYLVFFKRSCYKGGYPGRWLLKSF